MTLANTKRKTSPMTNKTVVPKGKTAKTENAKVYEFLPTTDIQPAEILELSELLRIGCSGYVIESMSENLRKHFREIKK